MPAKNKDNGSRRTGLGDVLVARKVVSAKQLQQAQRRQKETGRGLAPSIVELGLATEEQIVEAIAAQTGMRFVDLRAEEPDPSSVSLIDGTVARRHAVLPVGYNGDRLVLAMADPHNEEAIDEVSMVTGLVVEPAYATRGAVLQAIQRVYELDPGTDRTELVASEPSSFEGTDNEAAVERVGRRLGTGADDEMPFDIHEVLEQVIQRGGSDLHITGGVPPMIRLHGELMPMREYPVMKPMALQKVIYSLLTQKQRERLESELELDMSYTLPGRARFRVNVYVQRSALGAAFRLIPFEIKGVDQLGLPPQIAEFAKLPRGLIVLTGPTGSGKSTTLAAVVDIINRERAVHIMTVEDPIEFLHVHKKAMVNQREVGEDTKGFANALKHVLRQDPDVILVGEMRDLETIHMAITAAETGHLVLGTLHTQDAPQTIDRIIDVFPPHQQQQVRVQLAGSLMAVVAQQLLQTVDGRGRVVAAEVLVATAAVRNLIREAKTHQIYSIMQAGAQFGMQTMDSSLATLVRAGRVTQGAAFERCHHADELGRLVGAQPPQVVTRGRARAGDDGQPRARVVG